MIVDNEFATEAEAVVSESAPIALEATVRGRDTVLIVDEADALVAVGGKFIYCTHRPALLVGHDTRNSFVGGSRIDEHRK